MDTSRQIVVINMAGNEVTKFDLVDLTKTSGWDLKQMIANVTGFPSVGMQLRIVDDELTNRSTLDSKVSHNEMKDACVTVTCVLAAARPFGKKLPSQERAYFGSKAGMAVERQLLRDDGSTITGLDCISKEPGMDMAIHARNLIKKSFAQGLGPLIDMAVDVACHGQGMSDETDTTTMPCIYEDESGAYADLSFCKLWTRTVQHVLLARRMTSPLVCTVLWRLLPTWKGDSENENGPVLEVLFLATGLDFREMGVAKDLVVELENTAKSMGCVAVAVAAVPCQGESFWRKCGYEVAVPLMETAKGSSDTEESVSNNPGLGEPLTHLGEFLVKNMMLFTDTPLVAKLLTGTKSSWTEEELH